MTDDDGEDNKPKLKAFNKPLAVKSITSGGGGRRELTERVKTSRGRKTSSTRWLQRQLNDPYVAQAKIDGYRSRSAYKLLELDDKFQFLKKNAQILDLGAAPGGWTQVAIEKMGLDSNSHNKILAIDILEMQPIAGAEIILLDFMDNDAPQIITSTLGGKKVDVLMSDIAPNTTGHAKTDHIRIIALCEMSYDFALEVLNEGGVFICKVRQGGTEGNLLKDMQKRFRKVSHMKPKSSRKESSESYVIAQGFRG